MPLHRFGKSVLAAVTGAIIALTSASAASADTTYYLKNVKFDDGTFATGSFTTNISGYPAGHDVMTTTGDDVIGYHYTNDINITYNPGDSRVIFYHFFPSYQGFLQLAVAGPISAIGATPVALLTGSSFECSNFTCLGNEPARAVVSGFLTTVSPVPEAANWGLMLIGVGGTGFALRRIRNRSASQTSAFSS